MTLLNALQLIGGVGIFLYSIKMISESLQLLAGNSLQNLIGMLTKTPVLGVMVGTLVTVLIQSSSATTVMTVSFVDAGLMTLKQAIGVIMGANIGTTVTGQIIAFKIKDFCYLFIIIGSLLQLFGKSNHQKYLGGGLFGFGLLFIGMQTMESSMSILKTRGDLFLMFKDNPLLGVLAGTVLTLLIQSSSATVGLTIALGMQGLLPLEAAIPIVLGDNIGTTITAVLASIGTCRHAKQACLAHVLFNVIGVCIFLPLMPVYIDFIRGSADTIGHQIANAHTLFNVCNTLLFLPFVGIFAKLITTIIPDPQKPESRKSYLDPKLITFTPAIAVDAVKNECLAMGAALLETIDKIEELFFLHQKITREELQAIENLLDKYHASIQDYSQKLMRQGITDKELVRLHAYVSSAGDMERIGDKCKMLYHLWEKKEEMQGNFSEQAISELQEMFDLANTAIETAVQNISLPLERAKETLPKMEEFAQEVRKMETSIRHKHVNRLAQGLCSSSTSLSFLDAVGAIEHMCYRAKKMTQVIVHQQDH